MPRLTLEDGQSFDIPHGKRLVLALTEDAGVDQLHACGGKAKCTTCRVEFLDGEPPRMTQAEKNVLAAKNITTPGVRLSCQIPVEQDMTVRIVSRLEGSGRADAGSPVNGELEPQPVEWLDR